ncbi:MAG: 16S rRNA (cytosine(1402)-N(4))-methyltransferase RsmH [Stenotrophobium sp.]
MWSSAIRPAAQVRTSASVFAHNPVMLTEALAGLGVRAGGIYLDGTFGRGGHSGAILDALGGTGALHALDQDPEACAHASALYGARSNFHIHQRNFSQLGALAAELKLSGRIDGILLDLGVSSPQFDDAARGFSFANDGPLDMRMNPQAGESAAQWLARAPEQEIAEVLWRYGDERNSRRIARRIAESRAEKTLTGTAQLAALIATVPGPRSRHIHPATRSFQAIRIHINRELEVLEAVLTQAVEVLAPGGRLAVISFHSLEDRIVKRFLRDQAREADVFVPHVPRQHANTPPKLRLTGRRQMPAPAELEQNPRARSAVLRVAERLP